MCYQEIAKSYEWLNMDITFGIEQITLIVLFLTLFVYFLMLMNGHRPFVGISKCDAEYDLESGDLKANFVLKNTGNVPANNVRNNMYMYANGIKLGGSEGSSRWLIMPGDITHGIAAFHKIKAEYLERVNFTIEVEVVYEHPLLSHNYFMCCRRKFITKQILLYENNTKRFKTISGFAS